MFEPLFELMPSRLRTAMERFFHGYCIHSTAAISRGVKIIYNDKRNKGKFTVGEKTFVGVDCIIDITDDVTIGKNVQIAPGARIFTHDSSPGKKTEKPVFIADNAYLGTGSIVLPGVRIGEKAVVAAGSVVTKEIAPNAKVAGIPAKPLNAGK